MRRAMLVAGAMALAFLVFVPLVAAAEGDELPRTGRVLVSVQGDVTLPAGEQADTVVVVRGNADIQGTVKTLVVVDGTATLTGATVENFVLVRGSATLGAGTTVLGNVRTLDATVDQQAGAVVQGTVGGLEGDLANIGLVLGPALLLLYIGFALATIVAGLFLVAIGTRQVRAAADLVRREPLKTFLWGLAAVFLPPIAAVLLLVTVVGAPLGLGIFLLAWPLLAYVGYLFAGVMFGDWLVTRMRSSNAAPPERPYLGAVIGLLIVQVLAIVPFVSFVVSFIGMGAALQLAWRTMRGTATPTPTQAVPTSWGTGTQSPG